MRKRKLKLNDEETKLIQRLVYEAVKNALVQSPMDFETYRVAWNVAIKLSA